MSALLILTVGQTDVQIVNGDVRKEIDKKKCASLHDQIESRKEEWRLVAPLRKSREKSAELPKGDFALCTPKLDAVLDYCKEKGVALTAALILETRRDADKWVEEPRFAGTILATRLRDRGIADVDQVSFLNGTERLEDKDKPRDAVIRREVVKRIECAISDRIKTSRPDSVIVATTGGLPDVMRLVDELVPLFADKNADVDLLAVPDGDMMNPPEPDRAVSRQQIPEPAASYQARWHALKLIEDGNLLGAWGAVRHLHKDGEECRWTQVVEWLACFASSVPIPADCDIPVLTDRRRAVRAALRVELALRAGDIPRAVHGTVAFFESALWDHLCACMTPHHDPKKRRLFKVEPPPCPNLVRGGHGDDRKRPFEVAEESNGVRWYKIFDDDVCGIRLAKRYLQKLPLEKLGQAVSAVRDLRNDVAHNEPTPDLMENARRTMIEKGLWAEQGGFMTQPLVQNVLRDLGEQDPDSLCTRLLSTVRARLLDPGPSTPEING